MSFGESKFSLVSGGDVVDKDVQQRHRCRHVDWWKFMAEAIAMCSLRRFHELIPVTSGEELSVDINFLGGSL